MITCLCLKLFKQHYKQSNHKKLLKRRNFDFIVISFEPELDIRLILNKEITPKSRTMGIFKAILFRGYRKRYCALKIDFILLLQKKKRKIE